MMGSPCIGTCVIDEVSGLCRGCARSREEIGRWRDADEDWRQEAWRHVVRRLERWKAPVRRPPWSVPEIRRFVRSALVRGAPLSLGPPHVRPEPDVRWPRTEWMGSTVLWGAGQGVRVRIEMPDHVRLLEWMAPGPDDGAAPVVGARALVVHQTKSLLPIATSLQELGTDEEALDPTRRTALLFDLGLGLQGTRVLIQTKEPAFIQQLRSWKGQTIQPLTENLRLLPEGVARVESALARVEVPDLRVALRLAGWMAPAPRPKLRPNVPPNGWPDEYRVGLTLFPIDGMGRA